MERKHDCNMEQAYHMHNYPSTGMHNSTENYPFLRILCSILPLWIYTSSIYPA